MLFKRFDIINTQHNSKPEQSSYRTAWIQPERA